MKDTLQISIPSLQVPQRAALPSGHRLLGNVSPEQQQHKREPQRQQRERGDGGDAHDEHHDDDEGVHCDQGRLKERGVTHSG